MLLGKELPLADDVNPFLSNAIDEPDDEVEEPEVEAHALAPDDEDPDVEGHAVGSN